MYYYYYHHHHHHHHHHHYHHHHHHHHHYYYVFIIVKWIRYRTIMWSDFLVDWTLWAIFYYICVDYFRTWQKHASTDETFLQVKPIQARGQLRVLSQCQRVQNRNTEKLLFGAIATLCCKYTFKLICILFLYVHSFIRIKHRHIFPI